MFYVWRHQAMGMQTERKIPISLFWFHPSPSRSQYNSHNQSILLFWIADNNQGTGVHCFRSFQLIDQIRNSAQYQILFTYFFTLFRCVLFLCTPWRKPREKIRSDLPPSCHRCALLTESCTRMSSEARTKWSGVAWLRTRQQKQVYDKWLGENW